MIREGYTIRVQRHKYHTIYCHSTEKTSVEVRAPWIFPTLFTWVSCASTPPTIRPLLYEQKFSQLKFWEHLWTALLHFKIKKNSWNIPAWICFRKEAFVTGRGLSSWNTMFWGCRTCLLLVTVIRHVGAHWNTALNRWLLPCWVLVSFAMLVSCCRKTAKISNITDLISTLSN